MVVPSSVFIVEVPVTVAVVVGDVVVLAPMVTPLIRTDGVMPAQNRANEYHIVITIKYRLQLRYAANKTQTCAKESSEKHLELASRTLYATGRLRDC